MKRTKVFMDCEFTGLHQGTTLISIGMIAEDGRELYCELNDYDKTQIDDWLKDNVIANLHNTNPINTEQLRKAIEGFIEPYDTVELISDVSCYDMVLFCELFGGSLNLPKKIVPVCYNICQDIAKFYNCSMAEAFDKSREDIVLGFYPLPEGVKHNALYDAQVIKLLYKILQ